MRRSRRLLLALVLLSRTARAADDFPWPVGTRSVAVSLMAGQNFAVAPDGFSETAVPNLEASWTIAPRLELGGELHPALWVNQQRTREGSGRQDTVAFAGDAILRWFPVPAGRQLAPYAEIALGFCASPDRIPPSGTRLNFLVQAGAGIVVKSGTKWSTVVGWRWLHISNGNFAEQNPGVNFSLLVVGGRLSVP